MKPCRINCFGDRTGWQAHNPCAVMEAAMARLPGSGSFYWPNARAAYYAARRFIRAGICRQATIETISGRKLAVMFRAYCYSPD